MSQSQKGNVSKCTSSKENVEGSKTDETKRKK